MPCLGLLKVAALTPPDWQVTIIDEKVEPLPPNLEADLVGITTMTTTVERGYEIADLYRRRGAKVVMGGMHASCLPDEACNTATASSWVKLKNSGPSCWRISTGNRSSQSIAIMMAIPRCRVCRGPIGRFTERNRICRCILSRRRAAAQSTVSFAP